MKHVKTFEQLDEGSGNIITVEGSRDPSTSVKENNAMSRLATLTDDMIQLIDKHTKMILSLEKRIRTLEDKVK